MSSATVIQFLTTQELAALLRISPRTVESWRYKSDGPKFHRIGRRALYADSDVREWLAEFRQESTSAEVLP